MDTDCMACRMVWKQVEMDVSNARYIEDVQASFEHNCMNAQKSNIFYKAVSAWLICLLCFNFDVCMCDCSPPQTKKKNYNHHHIDLH